MTANEDNMISENFNYEHLGVSQDNLKGLEESGIPCPSCSIISNLIPMGLNGFDLVVFGEPTVDTKVASVLLSLEMFNLTMKSYSAIIVCQDDEVVASVWSLSESIGKYVTDWKVESIKDEECKELSNASLIVGNPHSIKTSITTGALEVDKVQLFIIHTSTQTGSSEQLDVIKDILTHLKPNIQVIFFCNNYEKTSLEFFENSSYFVPIEGKTVTPYIFNYKQFFTFCKTPPLRAMQMKVKSDQLLKIFENISFSRCIVFSNFQSRVKSLSSIANEKGLKSVAVPDKPSIKYKRPEKCNIIFATDDTASNIDMDEFDLVINYDIPTDAVKFLHRLCWRRKQNGVCITLSTDDNEMKQLQNILCSICGPKLHLPQLTDKSCCISDLLDVNCQENEKIMCSSQFVPDISLRNEIQNLKKQPANIKTKSKKKKKSVKAISNDVDSSIMDILNETSNEVKELREQLSDMTTDSMFQCLASGNFSFDSKNVCESESSQGSNEENRKGKNSEFRTLFEVIKSQSDCVNNVHDKSESVQTNSEERKQEEIFYRNKALLDVTKIVTDKSMTHLNLDSSDENSILTHLNMLKDKEQEELSQTQIEDISDILRKVEETNGEILASQSSGKESETDNIQLEEIFNFGFESIIQGKNTRWKMQLAKFKPDKNRVTSEDTTDNSDSEVKETVETLDDKMDENVEADEYSFMKWIPVTSDKDNSKEKHRDESGLSNWVPLEQSPEIAAEPLELYNKYDMTENCNTIPQPMYEVEDSDLAMYRHYEDYYQNCSDNLWHNALTFSDVNSFDEWFYCNWELQLGSIRSYIQQNIYVQEMSHYKNSRNLNGS